MGYQCALILISSACVAVFDPWTRYDVGIPAAARDDPFVLPRHALVHRICLDVHANTVVRITAPPASGKSSLAILITARLTVQLPDHKVTIVPCLLFEHSISTGAALTDEDIERTLFRKLGVSAWSDVVGHILLFDDGLRVFESGVGRELCGRYAAMYSIKLVFFNAFYTVTSPADVSFRVLSKVRIQSLFTLRWIYPCHLQVNLAVPVRTPCSSPEYGGGR